MPRRTPVPQEDLNPEHMRAVAESFCELGRLGLGKSRRQGNERIETAYAVAACFAFAVELYLKVALTAGDLFHGEVRSSHDLGTLYDKLAETTKEDLGIVLHRDRQEVQLKIHAEASTFVHWRYAFEQPSGLHCEVGFLKDLADALKQLTRPYSD